MNQQTTISHLRNQTLPRHIAFTGVAAATAAIAAGSSAALGLPVWAMFIGWVAFFTRGLNAKAGVANLACVWLGIVMGMCAALSLQLLGPVLGAMALPLVVFVVAMLVVSLRSAPGVNNLLGYFLGLIAFFAAHLAPSFSSFWVLACAATIGSCAAFISLKLQQQLPRIF